MPHLPPYLQACGFWYADVAFTIFAPDLLLSFDILGTYLPGCQCANPFFCPVLGADECAVIQYTIIFFD